jgi:hypothetical protein
MSGTSIQSFSGLLGSQTFCGIIEGTTFSEWVVDSRVGFFQSETIDALAGESLLWAFSEGAVIVGLVSFPISETKMSWVGRVGLLI